MTTVYLTARTSPPDRNSVALRLANRGGEEVILTNLDLIVAANSGARRSFYRSRGGGDGVYLAAHALAPLPSSTTSAEGAGGGGVGSILPWSKNAVKLSPVKLLSLAMPTILLISSIVSYLYCDAKGFDAVFPSTATFGIVLKMTVWMSLILVTGYEHVWFFSNHPGKHGGGGAGEVKMMVTIEGWASERHQQQSSGGAPATAAAAASGKAAPLPPGKASNFGAGVSANGLATGGPRDSGQQISEHDGTKSRTREFEVELKPEAGAGAAPSGAEAGAGGSKGGSGAGSMKQRSVPVDEKAPRGGDLSKSVPVQSQQASAEAAAASGATATATDRSLPHIPSTDSLSAPSAPATQVLPPERFIKAEKGDIISAQKRYTDTLAWREEMRMDSILTEPHPNFTLIKKNYPHYYHLRGRNNEPCYYESPPKMKLQALADAGVTMDDLLRHYAMTCEFMWTHVEPSEDGKSIYVIDLEGMGIRDFAGDVVDFVKKTSAFTSAHYPERSGSIFIVNVPSWFSIIWNTVKPWVDEVTRQKIKILKSGKTGITRALEERVAIENIPPEYGGKSMKLGEAPEELMFREKILSNNRRYQAEKDGMTTAGGGSGGGAESSSHLMS